MEKMLKTIPLNKFRIFSVIEIGIISVFRTPFRVSSIFARSVSRLLLFHVTFKNIYISKFIFF